ncbi:MAG: universal stress protein [Deltaproteobacteria bacterium]|nr:universal stress protein [Deltaproteobacteria bacterium]
MTEPNDSVTTWPPKRVLVPLDFSKHSAHALDYAVNLAEAVDATVWVLHVGTPVPPIYSPMPESTAAQAQIWGDMLAEREAIQRREIAEATAPYNGREVAIQIVWREGEAATAIVEAANEVDAHMIVMGSHGRTGIKRALMGSVAERTARLSSRPVLVLR